MGHLPHVHLTDGWSCGLTSQFWRAEGGATQERRRVSVAQQLAVRRQPVRLGEESAEAQLVRRNFVDIGSLRRTHR